MNKKQEKKVLSLRKKGMSIKNIAKEVGVGERSVSKFLKEAHETKQDEPAKAKGPIIGKYVKIADPKKAVEGTDEVRIKFKKPEQPSKSAAAEERKRHAVKQIDALAERFLDKLDDLMELADEADRLSHGLKRNLAKLLPDCPVEEDDREADHPCDCDCDCCDCPDKEDLADTNVSISLSFPSDVMTEEERNFVDAAAGEICRKLHDLITAILEKHGVKCSPAETSHND